MNTDIAIVGLSGLFPGAKNTQTYWQNILDKIDNVRDAPESWIDFYLEPDSEDFNRIYTSKVGLLGELAEFNPLEFGVPPKSIEASEPDQFLALKLARDALADAGYLTNNNYKAKTGVILGRGATPSRGTITGVQYGIVVDQTLDLLTQFCPELDRENLTTIRQELKSSLPSISKETIPGLVSNVVVGRIANRLDLSGPTYTIDAACASSLIAVELAIKELRSHRSDLMLAGGVQVTMSPLIYMLFCQLNALSRTKIRPFDRTANGTVLAEGAGFLVLKRLKDAERDGDRIYAVLKEIGLSSDGKGLGLLSPRLEGEVLAIQRAYSQSGIDPETITLIEAHGTGIPLGDKTEIAALKQVFGKRQEKMPRCGLGSVKSSIGHCIPGAGIASLIKMSLALHHKILPPTLCDRVNPDLNIEETPFYINTETQPWIHGKPESPRRAGVNAFGFGGINAHAILEEYTGAIAKDGKQFHSRWPQELLIFSAEDRQSLLEQIVKIQKYIQTQPLVSLADLAYTLANRKVLSHRLVLVAKDVADLDLKLSKICKKLSELKKDRLQTKNGIYYRDLSTSQDRQEKIAFLFPGEGSQYPHMLADLCLYFPQVRNWFDRSDRTFIEIGEDPPSYFVFPPPTGMTPAEKQFAAEGLYKLNIANETVFTANMALYELLKEFKINSDVMLGHSTGEYAALLASGIMQVKSNDDLSTLKKNLNQIYQEVDGVQKGALLTVGGVTQEFFNSLLAKSQGKLYLAIDNCPNQKVLFGDPEDIKTAAAQIKAEGGICQELPFDRGYHTPLFSEKMKRILENYYQDLPVGAAKIPLYSCASTKLFPDEPSKIRELAVKQWSSTVKFSQTIEKIYSEGIRTFIEVGPSSNLTSFVNDTLRNRDYQAIASNTQRKPALAQLQTLLAQLFVKGMNVDFAPLFQHREVKKIDFNLAITPANKFNVTIDLSLPKMSLTRDFVKTIQEQKTPQYPVSSSLISEQQLLASEPISHVEIAKVDRTSEPTYLEDITSETTPVKYENTQLSGDTKSSIVALHFDLMQEFLANQSRIAEAFLTKDKFSN